MAVAPRDQAERARLDRVEQILRALDLYTDDRAAVLLVLTDDQTPNKHGSLRRAGLPISAGGATQQLFTEAAPLMGKSGIDREQRDYVFPSLIEVGLVERMYVHKASDLKKKPNELFTPGLHLRAKSMNNSYRGTADFRRLVAASASDFKIQLPAFLGGTSARRRRELQQRSAATAVGNPHSQLIQATVHALRATLIPDFDLVYVDDSDGDRIRPKWLAKLERLNLKPALDTLFPDAILVHAPTVRVWFVDAVTSDGEIDETRREGLEVFARNRGYTVAGYTTSYETWKRLAQRQTKMKNLAVGTTIWVAEDGGKLFAVDALA